MTNTPYKNLAASGDCWQGIHWRLTTEGKLTVSGIGSIGFCLRCNSPHWYDDFLPPIHDCWRNRPEMIRSVRILRGITTIMGGNFAGLPNLTDVSISDTVTTIDYSSFCYCPNLTSVTIPASVTHIGGDAFAHCTGLTDIVFQGSAPIIDKDAFKGVTATVHYRANDPTWLKGVPRKRSTIKDYGGTLTWVDDAKTFKSDV